jgi:4-amino-4-deoxy-L-arabinose transferase-like glycosyltransferase
MLLIVSGLLIVVSALALSDLYRLSTWSARIVAFYVFCWAHIVVVAQTVGALNVLRPAPYFVMQIIVCAVCVAVWYVVRRRELSTYAARIRARVTALPGHVRSLRAGMGQYPVLALFALAVLIAAGLWAFQAVGTAPNSFDARLYHLARVGYWMQHENLYPWDTLNVRQTTFPMVSSFGFLWVAIFDGTERLFNLSQYSAGMISAVTVYGAARLIGAARPQAAFSALVWLSFPIVALQTSSTLNDLLVAAFIIIAVYLFMLGIKTHAVGALVVSGLSIGLALGTKSTTYFVLPGLALGALVIWLSAPRQRFGLFLRWGLVCIAGILTLGSFVLFTNYAQYDNPLGSPALVEMHTGERVNRLVMLAHNTLRYGYLFFDPDGLPQPISQASHTFRTQFIGGIADLAGLDLNSERTRHAWQEWEFGVTRTSAFSETRTWFGMLGFILITSAVIAGAWYGIRRRDPFRLLLVIIPLVFALLQFTLEPFSINVSRYFVSPALITMPLVAVLLPTGWLRGIRPILVVIIAIYLMFNATLHDYAQPIQSALPFWQRSPLEQQTHYDPVLIETMNTLTACVPEDAWLGIVNLYDHNYEYNFFTPSFTRKLRQFQALWRSNQIHPPLENFPELKYLLVDTRSTNYVPDDFVFWRHAGRYDLYVRAASGEQIMCASETELT